MVWKGNYSGQFNKSFSNNYGNPFGGSGDSNSYLVPSRMIVSRKILECKFKLDDAFRRLAVDKANVMIIEECSGWVVQTYMMLMVYSEEIKANYAKTIDDSDPERDKKLTKWDRFIESMDKSISEGKTRWSYEGLQRCVFMLQWAAYYSGITKIEFEKSEIDDYEATRKWRG